MSCGCIKAHLSTEQIEPGASLNLNVAAELNSVGLRQHISLQCSLTPSIQDPLEIVFDLIAPAFPTCSFTPNQARFHENPGSSVLLRSSITLVNPEHEKIVIEKVATEGPNICPIEWNVIDKLTDRQRLSVISMSIRKNDIHPNNATGRLSVVTNNALTPTINIPYEVDRDLITRATPSALAFGSMRQGETSSRTVQVDLPAGFTVNTKQTQSGLFSASPSEYLSDRKCHFRIECKADTPGRHNESLEIVTSDGATTHTLAIKCAAFVADD